MKILGFGIETETRYPIDHSLYFGGFGNLYSPDIAIFSDYNPQMMACRWSNLQPIDALLLIGMTLARHNLLNFQPSAIDMPMAQSPNLKLFNPLIFESIFN
ncbi:hypothetical protein DN752_15170 [Echinicola strongylocentroti]|uniref:Uncharacterized protein n=1 Tax=Echinicola strongylocentroti TaxID=1795355 RepID=A0A2Z4IK92_9BACT|nr:hypothetical protein [Echinicola strongylocentroti]AWW31355.1 hypothetical protein DN752_15170 [Echinicola strongylocentroti]